MFYFVLLFVVVVVFCPGEEGIVWQVVSGSEVPLNVFFAFFKVWVAFRCANDF